MTTNEPSGALERTLAAIRAAAERSVGVDSYEYLLVELLDLLRSAQVDRSEAVTALTQLATAWSPGSPEVLEFTMHELRWPEVRAALVTHSLHGSDFRTRNLAAQVLEAFDDDWPAGEIYGTYRRDS